jgi:hypothetical protein
MEEKELMIMKSKTNLARLIADSQDELADLNLKIFKCKENHPINISELLGLMNKADLVSRRINQLNELFPALL